MRGTHPKGAHLRRKIGPSLEPCADETLDSICGGRVRLAQKKAGYRFNLDPILLVHFAVQVSGGLRGPTMDLGTGNGVIPLVLARKFGRTELTGLEIQRSLYELAERNVECNRAERRLTLVLSDIRQVSREGTSAKLVLIHAVKGGGAQLEALAPLWIHQKGSQDFSPEVRAMLSARRGSVGGGGVHQGTDPSRLPARVAV